MKNIKSFKNFNEGMVAGELIKPEVQAAIMVLVPTVVALILGNEYKEEVIAWLKSNMKTVADLYKKQAVSKNEEVYVAGSEVDPQVMAAIMAIVPSIVALAFGHTFKAEISDWLAKNRNRVKGIFSDKMSLYKKWLNRLTP